MSVWYYVDRAQNRQGPVDAGTLADAVRQGQLDDASLVWREGLAHWAPLIQFRSELGLTVAPTAPGAAPAPAAAAAAKTGGCGVTALILVGVGIFLIFVLGILAAIALPAYQDYTVRSKLAAVLAEAGQAKVQVAEFVANTDRCPRDASELQLPAPSSPGLAAVDVVPLGGGVCVIELTLAALPGAASLEDGRIYLRLEQDGHWSCSSDLAQQKYLPASCR